MPDFLAQSYLADRGKALAVMGRARQIQSPLLLRAILVPGDEIFLTLWRGPDADAVDMAAREVGLDPDRVVPAEDLLPGPAAWNRDGGSRAGPAIGLGPRVKEE